VIEATGSTTKLKICHLISGDLWAGAEVMAFYLLSGLGRLPGIELLAILLNKGRLAHELRKAGVPTYVLDEGERSFPAIVGMAARKLRKWAPHVLHSHRYKENLLSFLVSLALKNKAALVSTQHGLPEFYGGKPDLLRKLKLLANHRLLASRFDRTIAVSADIKESLSRDYRFQEKRLETIRNGIVIPELHDRTGEKHKLVIGSAGRFVPVKDYPLMVEVAKELLRTNHKVRFELAGDGPLLGKIQGLIDRYGIQERFALRGFVSDLRTFYGGLDVFLNTSLHEGIPMSVLEAMAHGVPPVAPRVGGLEEIVTDGVDGYLVNSRNPRDFAEKCLSLCNNVALRQNMGRAAREKVIGKFSVERMVQDYLDMYRSTIKESV